MRKKAWLAVIAAMMTGAAAAAQVPNGPTGTPGFPAPLYPPQMPTPGYPSFTYPTMPQPGAIPNIGTLPEGFLPPAPRGPVAPYPYGPGAPMPTYNGTGPKPGATQPYLVTPETKAPVVRPTPAPTVVTPMPTPFATFDGVDNFEVGGPSEPYTLYEGRRSLAEVKVDETTRMWARVNYVHWWVNRAETPPLVTTSQGGPGAGTLGTPGTTVALGGEIGPREFTGIQGSIGWWIDCDRTRSLEIAGFWVGKNSRGYSFTSDPQGNPVFAQPVLAPGEATLLTSAPGVFSGSINVSTIMDFHSAEINKYQNVYRVHGWSWDYLLGVRYAYLNDQLAMNQSLTVLPGNTLPFANAVQGPGSNFLLYDSFNATNRFFGGQMGARVYWTHCRWDLEALFKLGFGATMQTVVIDGSTTLNATNGVTTTTSGSSLALASNIGHHSDTVFSVMPEVNLTLGYEICPNLKLLAGYNFWGWSSVVRAGNQIDRNIDLTQSPTDGTFVPNRVGTSPAVLFTRSDFWAQGLSLGIELKY